MPCKISKVFNNNVVLAIEDGKQKLIIGRGVGFNKKENEIINIDTLAEDKKIFNIIDDFESTDSTAKTISNNIKNIEQIAKQITKEASEKLEIDNENLFDALFDHLTFSIERLRVGIPIENPFLLEITALCSKEMPIAQYTAALLMEKVHIDIGEDEIGFIALHLYSARHKKTVDRSMKNMRVYNEVLAYLSRVYKHTFSRSDKSVSAFLVNLSRYVDIAKKQENIDMPLKKEISLSLTSTYKIAVHIATMLQKTFPVSFSDEIISWITLDIYKLIQL